MSDPGDPPILVLQKEIQPGEKLLWSGIPVQGLRLVGADLLMIPFSLVWAQRSCVADLMPPARPTTAAS
jgi:hypothetical protein